MASKTDEDEIGSEDSGSDDGAEWIKPRLEHEEAESKAIDEDWAHLAAAETTSGSGCGSGWYVASLSNYGSTSFKVGAFFNCSPSGQTSLEALPGDHPIRAIEEPPQEEQQMFDEQPPQEEQQTFEEQPPQEEQTFEEKIRQGEVQFAQELLPEAQTFE
jgi:hypothetical protein